MDNKLLIELYIDENDQDNALELISFVSAPAIESNFMYFNSENKNKYEFKATDDEKRIVTGPAMISNQEIIRLDAEGNPYFVYFTEDTVQKASELFAKYGKTKATNFQHEVGMRDVTVIESWIVTDPEKDKSNALGFKSIPKGTWMVSYKVDNDQLWGKVKSGEVQGFSIEGIFSQRIAENDVTENLVEEMNSILNNEDLSIDEKYNQIINLSSSL